MHAKPGYFDITLASAVRAEMTTTNHTALYRFTFPENPLTPNTTLSPLILLELQDLPGTRTNASININGQSGRITAGGSFSPSFGIGRYSSYVCADFKGAQLKDAGVFSNSRATTKAKSLRSFTETERYAERPAGGFVQFQKPANDNQILVRVGLSFLSEAQACQNAEKEQAGFDFDGTAAAAEKVWTEKLDVIEIVPGGASEVIQTAFWSGVYRSMISPQDYTGENPLWKSDEPYYDSYYCIWDSFRSIHPLITLIDPHSQTQMIRSLLDIYKFEGFLPDCRMSFCKGNSMYAIIVNRVVNTFRFYAGWFKCGHRSCRCLLEEHHKWYRLELGVRGSH